MWRGSAFDCRSNQIVLRHSQFSENETVMKVCNDGTIIGKSIRRASIGLNFTSELIIQLNANTTLDGRTVECVHNTITNVDVVIGTHTIAYTTGIKLN